MSRSPQHAVGRNVAPLFKTDIADSGMSMVAGGVDYDPPKCAGLKKDRSPCRAPRAHGTMLCVGHLRSEVARESQ